MSILYPHHQSNADALKASQSLSTASEQQLLPFGHGNSIETWARSERNLLAALKTGDDKTAHFCLERLTSRFGPTNDRVMSLRGLYQEAVAKDEASLLQVLQDYDRLLSEHPSNSMLLKRKVVLLRHLGRVAEAITALTTLLDSSPTDLEAWTELAELYSSLALYPQAIFCVEEALLIAPNAWNVHARIGELLRSSHHAAAAGTRPEERPGTNLISAALRFCRSVELCENYFRGYFGLKLVTDELLQTEDALDRKHADSEPGMSTKTVQSLNQKATSRIHQLIARNVLSAEEQAIVIAEGLGAS